ncbi:hypothetical protein QR680_018827 [Steinernema hermaphroditum]|uniref:Band 7 domain-containing protein n=1 Tax=Steinernema hermaphroditum TaxID=289476 RepID=A0AA39LRP0_9BILA|nr:hypothetical protein QR680_018827 [Steinernema hermaphroditum]
MESSFRVEGEQLSIQTTSPARTTVLSPSFPAQIDPIAWRVKAMEEERIEMEEQERFAVSPSPAVGKSSQKSNESGTDVAGGVLGRVLTFFSFILIAVTFPISVFLCIRVVQEYERAVVFRFGKLMKGGARGPGIIFINPITDTFTKVDLRVVSFDVPPQEILSKDSVTVTVDAVIYFRISNATISVTNVRDAARSTKLLAQTTLRNILGTKTLSEMLSERESISHQMQESLDVATDPWGVNVERVEVKDVRLPHQLQRAMAAEAEAAREARAKVIAAEGEMKASKALSQAAVVMSEAPNALQLRYLQTLSTISAEKNSTIIFPFPIEMFKHFMNDQPATPRQSVVQIARTSTPEQETQ